MDPQEQVDSDPTDWDLDERDQWMQDPNEEDPTEVAVDADE